MTIKTYRTRELKGYSLHLFIDSDVRTNIVFKRGCTLGSTATYTTSDPKVQEVLESLNEFGPTFYIEKETIIEDSAPTETEKKTEVAPEPKIEEKEAVDILDAQTFKNLVELRNALQDKGIDVSQVTNVKAAESLAKRNGYNYIVAKNA
ncbi:MAG: hypothetical protein UD961_15890 [Bacteroidales bacterium]|nr:hypothetical protein [Bacteroidales bacterium]